MATTVVLTKVEKRANGSVYVEFGDGSGIIYPHLDDLKLDARAPDTNVDLTKKLVLAYALARSENLTNVASIQGKQFIFDLTNNNPIRVM